MSYQFSKVHNISLPSVLSLPSLLLLSPVLLLLLFYSLEHLAMYHPFFSETLWSRFLRTKELETLSESE